MKMKLTLDGIKDKKSWEAAGVVLPSYDIEKVKEDNEEQLLGDFWKAYRLKELYKKSSNERS